ncbi:hypothetical protein KVR01_013530 [Diaporthe batatas]|uniref:uncharacterized protein n=1 Tax=Diaporthe batatas TaxID=748121 RepID=UPI001D046FD3|nr:uncharacterized protein KVR01_013530 [Diaporthe batatas]KAG8156579.1 hypothetical protein KVR01_013530 [Diaporthe batatas]
MAQTTIVPFSTLPACVSSCGPLYDVNGACVPPAAPTADASAYDACFCSDARLAPYSTTTAGPCDAACAADPSGLASLTDWYKGLCGNIAEVASSSSSSSSGSSSSSSSSNSGGGGGTWLDGHWRWVVFIIVMVLGIAGIWIGAAFWRRSYLRKRDRQYALGKNLAQRTSSGQNPYGGGVPGGTPTRSDGSMHPGRPGVFMPASISEANVYETEKPAKTKDKWRVRT